MCKQNRSSQKGNSSNYCSDNSPCLDPVIEVVGLAGSDDTADISLLVKVSTGGNGKGDNGSVVVAINLVASTGWRKVGVESEVI